tara:strand:+ start:920 stop:1204 length:285 start_codon:yes stop_codon:yes gene_type:complete
MTWFDDIMEDPVAMFYDGTYVMLTYSQIATFRGLLLTYLITRRGLPREVALAIVGMWALRAYYRWHDVRRYQREVQWIGPHIYSGPTRFYGPGW